VCVRERERESVYVCVCLKECVCMCAWEREECMCVCVCDWGRSVSMREREREWERKRVDISFLVRIIEWGKLMGWGKKRRRATFPHLRRRFFGWGNWDLSDCFTPEEGLRGGSCSKENIGEKNYVRRRYYWMFFFNF